MLDKKRDKMLKPKDKQKQSKGLIDLAHSMMTTLNVDTPTEAENALQAVMAGLPVSAVMVVYRPNIPDQFQVSTLGIPKTAPALFVLNRVLGLVRDEIALQAMQVQGEAARVAGREEAQKAPEGKETGED